ncbi:MAG TPA: response regulator [Polyangiaceae bacterium]|nr:response regulator [Polyangiaceae bacterium]
MPNEPGAVRTVLVIDDSDAVLAKTRAALEDAGYRVLTRNRSTGSIGAILNDKPDIVLLEPNMPSLSGDSILKILGKTPNRPDTLLLLHSNLRAETLRLKSISTGAHGYIQKTDNAADFIRQLEHWLRRARPMSSAQMPVAAKFESPRSSDSSEGPSSASPAFSSANPALHVIVDTGVYTPPLEASSLRPRTLFADNDWTALGAYKASLGPQLHAEYVGSSEEAFERVVSRHPPDVVVCDVAMKGVSGGDLFKRAVRLDPTWAQRFVFVTGFAGQRAVADFLNEVEVRVFFKPVPSGRLLAAIYRIGMSAPQRRVGNG